MGWLVWLGAVALLLAACTTGAAEEKAPAFELPANLTHPCLACTPDELARLRAAYKGTGPEHDAVVAVIAKADAALKTDIVFPPRGGQHNQWYQCGKCQMGLVTSDDTHHTCPKCGRVYSGPPYDDVVFTRKHNANLSRMHDAAWAYAVTGDAKYADLAKKILLGYSERYLKYPYHSADLGGGPGGGHINEQTLGEASMMATMIAPAFDLVWNALSDAERAAIRDGLIVPMMKNIQTSPCGKSNWQTWHNAALFAGGVMAGDSATARWTIDDPRNGFRFQMGACVSKEGMWFENSWSYHLYTLMALVSHAEAARRVGIDLWKADPIRKMCLLPVQYTMPDGSLPRFGDAVTQSLSNRPLIEAAYHAYKASDLRSLLPDQPSFESVLYGRDTTQKTEPVALESRVFPDAGHAILRSEAEAGLTAAITFGPYGGFHGHFDKLSFVFFGYGQELGADPGRAKSQAYRLPIHSDWYKATVGHNAVLVDGASQKGTGGKLLAFAANKSCAAAAVECDTAYKGVAHRRLLVLTPTYLLVADDLASSAEHRFDWLYHNRGTGVSCDAAKADAKDEGYICNVKRGTTAETVRVAFAGEKVDAHLTMNAAPGSEVRTGHGPGESVLDRVPVAMVARTGKSARFAAVIEPVLKAKPPVVTDITLHAKDGALVITIALGDRADTVEWTRDNHMTVKHGGEEVIRGQ